MGAGSTPALGMQLVSIGTGLGRRMLRTAEPFGKLGMSASDLRQTFNSMQLA
jgi:hypothetical protein